MKKIIFFLLVFVPSFLICSRDLPPKPRFNTPVVDCKVTLVQQGMWKCHYEYYVSNPQENEIQCGSFRIVISGNENEIELIAANPQQRDKGRIVFREPSDSRNIPFTPNESFVSWIFDAGEGAPGLKEGPLTFTSLYPPQIRDAWLNPYIMSYVDSLLGQGIELTEEEIDEIKLSGIRKIKTLGPLRSNAAGFDQWNQFLADVDEAKNLNWIKDISFYFTIKEKLTSARQAALDGDLSTLDSKLQEVITMIENCGKDILTQESRDLIWINAKWFQGFIPWPCEPKLTLSPLTAEHSVGELHTVAVQLVNTANNQPLVNEPVTFMVTDGPNNGTTALKNTDSQGKATFSYFGRGIGTDTIVVYGEEGGWNLRAEKKATEKGRKEQLEECHSNGKQSNKATVQWRGGIDLSMVHFSPPYLISKPGKEFYVYDMVINEGNISSPPTLVKYFLSTNENLENGILVGQREVKALEEKEMDKSGKLTFSIPLGVSEGKYYLWACIDPDDNVIEIDEDNNCSYMNPFIAQGTIAIVEEENSPPDCSKAKPSKDKLWPPHHKLENISIQGITDPENDSFTVTVTSITQDEPTNGPGDGDTSPDGFGIGTSNPQVRSERSGTGNGRVYQINFKAIDSKGGECSGSVKVGVPHDKKDTPIDDGQNYDSTKP